MVDDRVVGDPSYTQNPAAISREVDGEVLIVPELREVLDLDDVFYRLSDPVSVFVWDLLSEPRTLEELIEAVTAGFEVDAGAAREDLTRFLDELVQAGAARRAQ